MIYFVVARYKGDEDIYNGYINNSLEQLGLVSVEVEDREEKLTLTKKYNEGIRKCLDNSDFELKREDVVIFCHSDVLILDKYFREKVEIVFQNEEIGLLGVIGTKEFTNNGMWWANTPDKLFGHIVQENGDKNIHLKKGEIGYCDEIVAVDGLLMAVKAGLIIDGLRFDEQFGFNFYDIDLCLQVKQTGKLVAIADVLVKHKSVGLGSLTQEWKDEKELLLMKWKETDFIKDVQ